VTLKLARPPARVEVPSTVEFFRNVTTAPSGGAPWGEVIVAVTATGWVGYEGFEDDVSATLVALVGNKPKADKLFCDPTYTFPLTIVGTENFTAPPGESRKLF
jgi:hypothetical protein